MSKNLRTADPAIEAAAELRLAGIRNKRVAAAEQKLEKAQQRLASCQQEEDQAAAAFAQYPSTGPDERPGNRQRLLSAREELELSLSLVSQAEKELTKARARIAPEMRDAAIRLATAEKKASTLFTDLDPLLAKVEAAAGELALLYRAVIQRIAQQSYLRMDQKFATEDLGLPWHDSMFATPDPMRQCAVAVLKGLQAQEFSPYDWQEVKPGDVNVPAFAVPGSQAVLEDRADWEVRNKRWQDSLHAQAVGTDAESAIAATQREDVAQAEARGRFDRQTVAMNQVHRSPRGGRASLIDDEDRPRDDPHEATLRTLLRNAGG